MKKILRIAAAALIILTIFPAITVGKAEDTAAAGVTVMKRLYNKNSGEHFYTSDRNEVLHLLYAGWDYEGIGWIAPASSNTPVYRLYNPNAGDHHYTMNANEKDSLVKAGWNYEGIGWYSDDAQSIPLYREYNPNAVSGAHNYTASKGENDSLVNVGWNAEGIGWYAVMDFQTYEKKEALAFANEDLKDPISKKRLTKDLHSESYSQQAIDYALANIQVDWKQQAVRDVLRFCQNTSYDTLYELILSDGFTEEEARYAVDHQPAR